MLLFLNCFAFCLPHDFLFFLKCVAQSLYLYQFIKHEVIIKQLLTYIPKPTYMYTICSFILDSNLYGLIDSYLLKIYF